MGKIMKNSIKSLWSNKQGLALIEFALLLPLLLLVFFGVVEFTRYVMITQRAERSVYALSNIMSQFTPIKVTEIKTEASTKTLDGEVFAQFSRTMDVYNTASDRIAIISSITKTGPGNNNGSITINWQRSGGGSLSSSEAVSLLNGVNAAAINSSTSENGSTAGTSPSFPGANGQLIHNAMSDMKQGENMIITETFYSYQPFLSNILGAFGSASAKGNIMKSVVFTRPRNGDIDTLKRPDDDTDPEEEQFGNKYSFCADITLVPVSRICSSKTEGVGSDCKVITKCRTCTTRKICKTCTTPINGITTCVVDSNQLINCTDSQTERACSTGGGGGGTGNPIPDSPPPS